MSTENATPTQVVTAQVPVQPVVNIITDTITLTAKQMYAQMSQFGQNAKAYRADSSMNGETYYTFKCKGAMINVPPAFQQAFVEKKLYSITITGRPYARSTADATVPGGTKVTIEQSWTYDSHMTVEDYKSAMVNDAEIMKLEAAMEMQTNAVQTVAKKAKGAQVSAERENAIMAELQALLQPTKVAVTADDEEEVDDVA